MGCGKSSVAIKLGEILNRKVIEMDDLVVKESKRSSINEIFSKDSEISFREKEIKTAKKLRRKTGKIISTGGGVVINKIILDYLKENGITIYLQTPFYEIVKRIGKSNSRPLFEDKTKAEKLFKFREVLYREYADIIVKTEKKSDYETACDIIERINTYGG